MINKKGFTIIEIIVATGILTVSVFGVYKLISENNKIIYNSNTYLNANMMIPLIENCIKNRSPSTQSSSLTQYYFDLGSDYKDCREYNNEVINTIDSIDYILSAQGIDNPIGTIWDINIYSDLTGNIKSRFIQK